MLLTTDVESVEIYGGVLMNKVVKLAKKIAVFGIMAVMMIGFAVPAMAAPINSKSEAERIALELYQGATVRKSKLENKKNGNSYYEVKLEQDGVRVEVKIIASTGVLRAGYDKNLFDVATITPTQARNTALNLYPGATVRYTELEYEKGVLVYEVKLTQANGRKAEVYINAETGAVVKNKAK